MNNFCTSCGSELEKDTNFCSNCGVNIVHIVQSEKTASSSTKTNAPISASKEKSISGTEKYASFIQRLSAYIIDYIAVLLFFIIVFVILNAIGFRISEDEANMLVPIFLLLYYSFMESSTKQATFGKQLLRIKVVDMSYQKISFLRAVGRHFGKIISMLILFIGIIIIFFTRRKQGLHDLMVSTLVVRA